jgi:DNA-binding transcriptional LysR family regulator
MQPASCDYCAVDLEYLRLFIEVARRGSFAAVARDHDLDPSSVSRTIFAIEAELGVRLFHRTTRRMTLSAAGEIYLARIEALVEDLDRASDEARAASAGPVGTLRLTAPVTFGQMRIAPLVVEFRTLYPDLKLEILLTDANPDLVADRIDLAIRLTPGVEADVVAVRLCYTPYRVCAAPEYLARGYRLRLPQDLARHRCLLAALPGYRSNWRFRNREGTLTDVTVSGDLMVTSTLALREWARAGLGPVLLPGWFVAADVQAGRLVDCFPDHEVTATTFDTAAWLLYPTRAFLPQKTRVMADFLRAEVFDGAPTPKFG